MPICRSIAEQKDEEEITCNQLWMNDSDADAVCEVIAKGKCTKLVLARNDFTDIGVKKIAEAMYTNTSIKFLSLAGNKITDEGAAAFLEVLEKNTTCTNIFLSSNKTSLDVCDDLWDKNAEREVPLKENLYGLVLDHKSPKQRKLEAEKKEAAKKKKMDGNS